MSEKVSSLPEEVVVNITVIADRAARNVQHTLRLPGWEIPELAVDTAAVIAETAARRDDVRVLFTRDPCRMNVSYACTVAKRLCFAKFRERSREREAAKQLGDLTPEFEHAPAIDDVIERRELAVHAAKNADLTVKQRKRLLAVLEDGKSNVDIAKDEGIDESAVRKSLRQAVTKIAAWLEEHGD